MQHLRTIRNQKGFTLVEIIAVLIILGILAAVAVPRYLDLQEEARIKAAQGAIAEIQGTFGAAHGSLLLKNNGAASTATQIQTEAGIATGAYGADFTVTITPADGAKTITIVVNSVKGVTVSDTTKTTKVWNVPS